MADQIDNNTNQPLDHANDAVIKTMEMYQSIITRMAGNSAACKQWCIPLVTAILVFAVEVKSYQLIAVNLIPVLICYCLDSYYLMLENRFRAGFNQAAARLAEQKFTQADLFDLSPAGCQRKLLVKAFMSPATWPVYLGLLALAGVVYGLII